MFLSSSRKSKSRRRVTDEIVPADITAVGIVLFKQLDGTTALFNNSFASQMHIYLKDKDGNYIQENGRPKAFPMASNGTFSVEGLSEQKYTMEVRYKAETGEELLLKVTQLDVKANGELNISEEWSTLTVRFMMKRQEMLTLARNCRSQSYTVLCGYEAE